MIGSDTTCRTVTDHGDNGDEGEGMSSKVRGKIGELAAKWRAKAGANPELAKLSLNRATDECDEFEGEIHPVNETELVPRK